MNYYIGPPINPAAQNQYIPENNNFSASYNQIQQFPARPPPIGFNIGQLPNSNYESSFGFPEANTNISSYTMDQGYNSHNIGMGWYGNSSQIQGGYVQQSTPFTDYSSKNQSYNQPFYGNSSQIQGGYVQQSTPFTDCSAKNQPYNQPFYGNYSIPSNYGSSGNSNSNLNPNNLGYTLNYNNGITNTLNVSPIPSAPFENSSAIEFTHTTVEPRQTSNPNENKNNYSNLKAGTASYKNIRGSTITEKQKSADYQRGLDKLASLMNDDIDLTEDVLRRNREKYDLNKSNL